MDLTSFHGRGSIIEKRLHLAHGLLDVVPDRWEAKTAIRNGSRLPRPQMSLQAPTGVGLDQHFWDIANLPDHYNWALTSLYACETLAFDPLGY